MRTWLSVLAAVGRRVLFALPVLVLVTVGTAGLVELMPGDPAVTVLGPSASAAQIAAFNERFGLDRPFIERYGLWILNAAQGDLGRSIVSNQPVAEAIASRLPVTLEIALLALILALGVAVPSALYAASKVGGRFDRVASVLASAAMSLPTFVLAIVLVLVLAMHFKLFSVTGWVGFFDDPMANLRYAFLPALTLAVPEMGFFFRLFRGDVTTTLQQDFILSARAKGLSRGYVLFRHALRPSSISLVTMIGLSLGRLIGGTVIVEFFFGLAGIGSLVLGAVPYADIAVIQGVVLLTAVIYVVINIGVDAVVAVIDPRVKESTA